MLSPSYQHILYIHIRLLCPPQLPHPPLPVPPEQVNKFPLLAEANGHPAQAHPCYRHLQFLDGSPWCLCTFCLTACQDQGCRTTTASPSPHSWWPTWWGRWGGQTWHMARQPAGAWQHQQSHQTCHQGRGILLPWRSGRSVGTSGLPDRTRSVVLCCGSPLARPKTLILIDFGVKSTFKHAHMVKIKSSYVKIIQSSYKVPTKFQQLNLQRILNC